MLFLAQYLAFSYAIDENGCPENLPKHCQCYNAFPTNISTSNLEFICDSKRLRDFDFYSLFRNLETSFAAPDSEDRQEKTAADDSDSVLNLGGKPRFYNLNITNSGLSVLDFRLLEQVHFKSINIINNRKLRQVLRAYHLSDQDPNSKFSTEKLVPVSVLNNVTETIIIESSPLLGQGKTERKLFDQLSRFKALKHLTLASNGLKVVPDQAFSGKKTVSKNLRSIDLKENRIREIGERAFSGLPALSRINLDGNDLVKLYDSSFSIDNSTSELMMIFLRYNRLDENSFEERTFEGLEKRHIFIYLTGNLLRSLPEAVFAPLLRRTPKKTFITLFENPLDCDDCSLRWLYDGKERFSLKVFGAVCQQTEKEIWKLPPEHFEERCSSN